MTRKILSVAVAAAALMLAAIGAWADSYQWTGAGGNAYMITLANWTPTPPDQTSLRTGGHDLTFAGSTQTSPTVQSAQWTINSVTFASGAAAFTLGTDNTTAATVQLGAGGITNNSANAQTVRWFINLTANQTWNLGAQNFTWGHDSQTRTLTLNNYNLTITGSGTSPERTWTFNQVITSGGGTGRLIMSGSTDMIVSGSNPELNGIDLLGGRLYLTGNNSGGQKVVVSNNAEIRLNRSSSAYTRTHSTHFEFGGGTGPWGIYSGYHANNQEQATSQYTFTGNFSTTNPISAGAANHLRIHLGHNDATMILSGNNSGLGSAKTAVNGTDQTIWLSRGRLIVNSDHALGANNALSIGVGQDNTGQAAQLLVRDGFDVQGVVGVGYRATGTQVGNQPITLGLDGAGTGTFSGNIILNPQNHPVNGRTVRLTSGSSGGTVIFSGVISDGGTIKLPVEIRGNGVVLLNGENTYTGATTVVSGATLGGSGVIASATTVDAGGMLAPGASVGKLTFGSSLTLSSGAKLSYELGADTTPGVTYDTVTVGGTLTLNSLRWSDITWTTLPGFGIGSYMLISAASITGGVDPTDYRGLVGGLPGEIGVAGNNLVLTVIPEPGTLFTLSLGVALLMRWRRHHRPN